MEYKEKWKKKMLEIHGSEEGITEFFRAQANKSKRNPTGKGGFNSYSKKERQAISQKGHSVRWGKTNGDSVSRPSNKDSGE